MTGAATLVLALHAAVAVAQPELHNWHKDASNDVYIEASDEGFESVSLNCDQDAMRVTVRLEEAFDGVFYTRGSYRSAKAPCFARGDGSRKVELVIPYGDCNTTDVDGESFRNTVVLQHDDLLIFPGDSAFELSCARRKELLPVTASIGLADPDPTAKELPKHRKSTVSAEGTVRFQPQDIRPRRKRKNEPEEEERTVFQEKDEL
jgi:hypothetical protein